MSKKLIGTVLLGAALFAVASTSLAGRVNPPQANCFKNPDGTGWCSGDFRGFRASADPDARAEFYSNHYGNKQFLARFNSQYYSCVMPTTPAADAFWRDVMNATGFFAVAFDNAGTCTYGYAYNSSAWPGL